MFQEILAHIKSQGGRESSWYVGIASNWQARLFTDHNVPKQDVWYIARQCPDDASARSVEDALIQLGYDGGLGGGDKTTVFVYAYLKIPRVTNP